MQKNLCQIDFQVCSYKKWTLSTTRRPIIPVLQFDRILHCNAIFLGLNYNIFYRITEDAYFRHRPIEITQEKAVMKYLQI